MVDAGEKRKAAPGWYPDPKMAGTQRYWDGAKWSDHVAPAGPAREPASSTDGLVTAGVVMMLIFPIGGFIAGAMLLGRRALAGTLLMLFSVASAFAWWAIVFMIVTADDGLDCAQENVQRSYEGLPLLDCD